MSKYLQNRVIKLPGKEYLGKANPHAKVLSQGYSPNLGSFTLALGASSKVQTFAYAILSFAVAFEGFSIKTAAEIYNSVRKIQCNEEMLPEYGKIGTLDDDEAKRMLINIYRRRGKRAYAHGSFVGLRKATVIGPNNETLILRNSLHR